MADIEISVDAGTSKRLLTAGKYCDKDILVSASGEAAEPVIQPLEVTANGVYNVPAGVDGYNPVSVNVSGGSLETITLNIQCMDAFPEFSPDNFVYVTKPTGIETISLRNFANMFNQSIPDVVVGSLLVISYSYTEWEMVALQSSCLSPVMQWGAYDTQRCFCVLNTGDYNVKFTNDGGFLGGASSSGGSPNAISDTEALNIITGGEEA